MSRHAAASNSCTASELLLLVSLLTLWLGITVLLGSLQPAGLGGSRGDGPDPPPAAPATADARVRDGCAVGGRDLVRGMRDRRSGGGSVRAGESCRGRFLVDLSRGTGGFYLGFVWVLVLLLIRHIEHVVGRYDKSRPLA